MARRAQISRPALRLLCAAECGSETERRQRAEGEVTATQGEGPHAGPENGEKGEKECGANTGGSVLRVPETHSRWDQTLVDVKLRRSDDRQQRLGRLERANRLHGDDYYLLDWMKPSRHAVCLWIHRFGEAAGGLGKNRRVPAVQKLSSYFL